MKPITNKKWFLRVPDSVIHNKKKEVRNQKRTSFCTQLSSLLSRKSFRQILSQLCWIYKGESKQFSKLNLRKFREKKTQWQKYWQNIENKVWLLNYWDFYFPTLWKNKKTSVKLFLSFLKKLFMSLFSKRLTKFNILISVSMKSFLKSSQGAFESSIFKKDFRSSHGWQKEFKKYQNPNKI